MALDLDGFAVMRVVAADPELFADIHVDMDRLARGCVVKQLKAPSTDLGRLRAICRTLDHRLFSLIVDGMTDAEVKALALRFDRHQTEIATASPEWRRHHLRALAEGRIEPAETMAAKPRRAKASRIPREEKVDFLSSKAMAVVRKR